MLRSNAALSPYRLFATTVKRHDPKLLPNIKASLFPRMEKAFQARFYVNLDNEFRHNPYVTSMLKHVDGLIASKACKISYSSCANLDLLHYHTVGSPAYYLHKTRTMVIPSSPTFMSHITRAQNNHLLPSFYRSLDAQYLCIFLHEANHAHDFIISKFGLPHGDAKTLLASKRTIELLPNLGMQKVDMALGIHYSNPVMESFRIALRTDLIELDDIAGDKNHPRYKAVIYFYDQLRKALLGYPVTVLISELKSRFIEFSTKGVFGPELLEAMLPSTTQWYLYEHLPNCEIHLRRGLKL